MGGCLVDAVRLQDASADWIVGEMVLNRQAYRRFSECAESVCDDEDGCGGEQREDDPRQPILSSIQAFVGQQPSAAVLDDASDLAEARTVGFTDLADVRLNPVA